MWEDKPVLRSPSESRTYRELLERASGFAGLLAARGVSPGDRVATICANRVEIIEIWLACGWLGAILVPVNTALRGAQLRHVLVDSAPTLIAVDEEALTRIASIAPTLPSLAAVWLMSPAGRQITLLDNVSVEEFPAPGPSIAPRRVKPGDTGTILYTGGTTGPSKGVCCPQAQSYWWGVLVSENLGISSDDVLYTVLPLFHTNALHSFWTALLSGATLNFGTRFSASSFWDELRASEATVTYLLGAMVSILLKRPESPGDLSHRVRLALSPATPAEAAQAFAARHGVQLVDGYGSTETNMAMCNLSPAYRPGSMGTVVNGFQARVVDEDDNDLPAGVPGELILRHDEPFSFATGYYGLPEQTTQAWRNLWFHTGDRVVRDEDGSFRFLDRIKDVIRRRGENISSYEVEQALLRHPAVAAVSVVPVPAELGEDEVMAFVVPRGVEPIDPLDLIRFVEPELAYFAVPRYIEFLDELPLTEVGRVRKFVLRERGVGVATWDREVAGYEVTR
jgi:crotonobetaine/carnitine-CoA ligase